MATRSITVDCRSGDGTRLTANDDNGSPQYVILRTTGGQPVHVSMPEGRELAAWLIEHCIGNPDD